MRARQDFVSSTGETFLLRIRSAASDMLILAKSPELICLAGSLALLFSGVIPVRREPDAPAAAVLRNVLREK